MAAGGYPDDYNKGDVIYGLENTETESTKVFHAGTAEKDGAERAIELAREVYRGEQQHGGPGDVAIALLASMGEQRRSAGNRLQQVRAGMDRMGESADLTGITIKPVDVGGVPGEWVLAGNADPNRRLLYLHGGAFAAGSHQSGPGII